MHAILRGVLLSAYAEPTVTEAAVNATAVIEHVLGFAHCSATETLDAEDKFSCDTCGCLQEAQKRIKIKQLPKVLCLHLKRFKYVEDLQRCVAAATLAIALAMAVFVVTSAVVCVAAAAASSAAVSVRAACAATSHSAGASDA